MTSTRTASPPAAPRRMRPRLMAACSLMRELKGLAWAISSASRSTRRGSTTFGDACPVEACQTGPMRVDLKVQHCAEAPDDPCHDNLPRSGHRAGFGKRGCGGAFGGLWEHLARGEKRFS